MKNVMILLLLYTGVKSIQSQNKLAIGASVSLVKFSNSNAAIIGDRYLFQVPSLTATYQITNRFSLGLDWSFNTIKSLGFISNSVNYNSYGGYFRYNFKHTSYLLNPYVLLGSTFVKSQNYAIPTLNFGIGNTYWLTDKIGINSQISYKFSALRFRSMRPHFQFSGGVVYRFNFTLFPSKRKRLWEFIH